MNLNTLIKPVFDAGYWLGAAAIVVCIALLILAVFVSWTKADDVMAAPVPVAKPAAPYVAPMPKVKP